LDAKCILVVTSDFLGALVNCYMLSLSSCWGHIRCEKYLNCLITFSQTAWWGASSVMLGWP